MTTRSFAKSKVTIVWVPTRKARLLYLYLYDIDATIVNSAETAMDLPSGILPDKSAIKCLTSKPSMDNSIDSLTCITLVDYKSESWHIAGAILTCLAASILLLWPKLSEANYIPSLGRCCDSNLVDSASSHMLVSKTKPCMSKYK